MNYLSKINRGAILTTLVILGIASYLIATAAVQNKEKPVIKQICEAYIQEEVSYNMLPDSYRKDDPDMNASALDDYIAEMEKDIIAYYPDNEQYYKYLIASRTADLTAQANGNGVVFQYTKTILRYDSITFDGDTAEVGMTCSTTIETKSSGMSGSSLNDKFTEDMTDNIILQKIDGKWKVLYASINRPYGNQYGNIKEPIYTAAR